MKKLFVVTLMMILSSQLFAQEEKQQVNKSKSNVKNNFEVDSGIKIGGAAEMPNSLKKGWDGKCPDYLDCTTGQIKYFEYKQDFTIDAPEVCGPLGITACVIQKGRYEVTRTSPNDGGKVVLTLKNKGKIVMSGNNKSFTIFGSSVKNDNCGDAGSSCFHSIASGNEKKVPITITPIFENDRCVAIELQYKGTDPRSPGF